MAWAPGLADALAPLLVPAHAALRRLVETTSAAAGPGVVAPEWADAAVASLADDLASIAARTLVHDLHRARAAGELGALHTTDDRHRARAAGERGALPADDGGAAERFTTFTTALADGGLDRLLAAHPVLERRLWRRTELTLSAHAELLEQLSADREALVTGLLGGDPGRLVASRTAGDRHGGGRAVSVLTFASGARVVHRPRPTDLHERFAGLVAWLDERGGFDLRTPRVLTRRNHGWVEFVAATPCTDEAAVHRFYRRQGVLLALLHALDGTDVHHENLVAVGEHPVLVDVETLFHPVLDVPSLLGPDPAVDALRTSVQRTALLPQLLVDAGSPDEAVVDVSGLGGGRSLTVVDGWVDVGLDTMRMGRVSVPRTTPTHLPVVASTGEVGDPRRHRAAILGGFRAAYETIARHRDELLDLVAGCADVEIRVVARPTSLYGALLAAALHPDALRDDAAQEAVLGLLAQVDGPHGDPVRERLLPLERAALDEGDVPLFTTTPASRDLRGPQGSVVTGLLPRAGLDAVRAKVAGLDEVDLALQTWVVEAALAASSPVDGTFHRSLGRAVAAPRPTRPVDPARLLGLAAGLADEVVARSLTGHGRAGWLGLELVDDSDWALLPMGAGLPHGYSGVALFLMQLASMTGAERYRDLARDALRPLPRLLDAMRTDDDLAVGAGCGAHGLGGIAWALGRGTVLDPENAALTEALHAVLDVLAGVDWVGGDDGAAGAEVDSARADVGAQGEVDAAPEVTWDDGLAGGLAAVLAVAADTGHPTADLLADRWATALVTLVTSGEVGPETLADGFARGPLGVATALHTYTAARPGPAGAAARAAAALLLPQRPHAEDTGVASARTLPDHLPQRPHAADTGVASARTLPADLPPRPHAADTGVASARTSPEDLGWCSGLAGAVLAELATGTDGGGAATAYGPVVLTDRVADLSLCHGRLGRLEPLVEAVRLGSSAAREALDAATADLIRTLEQGPARCGTPDGVPTPGLLVGLAGIGYGLLRLGFADVPSALLLHPGPTPSTTRTPDPGPGPHHP